MSKVNVPDEMLDAFMGKLLEELPESDSRIKALRQSWRKELNAVVQWLDAELEKMIEANPYDKDMYGRSESLSGYDRRFGHNRAIGMVRSMFLIPEPNPLKVEVPKAGTYHIDEQGKATECIKGEPKKDYSVTDGGWFTHSPQKEKSVAEEVNNLLFRSDVAENNRTMTANERIAEAFRRGFNKGSKHEI